MSNNRPEFKVVCKHAEGRAILTVSFDRAADASEIEIMLANRRAGLITADPRVDLDLALAQQLMVELQGAFDDGMSGMCQVEEVFVGTGFDIDAMGWQPGAARKAIKRFALHSIASEPAFETCLCAEHLTDQNKTIAIDGAKQHDADCLRERVGHPSNKVNDFDTWHEMPASLYPHMECIICGKDAIGRIRPSDTDYSPYETP